MCFCDREQHWKIWGSGQVNGSSCDDEHWVFQSSGKLNDLCQYQYRSIAYSAALWLCRNLLKLEKITRNNNMDDENPSEINKKNMKAFVGHCWVIFMVNIWKRHGQKLRRIVLLHFGLVTFRFHYGRDWKPLVFMISGSRTCPWLPNPIWFIFGDTRIPQSIQGNSIIIFENIMFGNLTVLKIPKFENVRKGGHRLIMKIRLINSS